MNAGDQYLNMLFDFGIGDYGIIRTFESAKLNCPTTMMLQLKLTVWTLSTWFIRNVNTIAGGDLDTYNTYVSRRTQSGITRIGVDLIGQYFRVGSTMDRNRWPTNQISKLDTNWHRHRSWTNQYMNRYRHRMALKRVTRCASRFYYEVDAGQYDVRVRRTTNWSTTDSRVTASALYASLKGFEANEADFSGRNPYAMRIKATGQINGRVDRLSAIVNQKVPTWNGTVWIDNEETSNPAWIYYKVSTRLVGWKHSASRHGLARHPHRSRCD